LLTWLLADLAEWIHSRPSTLLDLPAAGYSEATCLDFDFAVRALKRWADRRANETKLVPAPEPPKKPMRPVPVFETLAEVLALDDRTASLLARTADPSIAADAAELLAAMRTGTGNLRGLLDQMA
jgi:hypothetical protein